MNGTQNSAETYKVGDVIQDSYGNPAVIMTLDHRGMPGLVCQTVGSDYGRVTGAPMRLIRVTDPGRIERARQVGRDVWRSSPARFRAHRPVCDGYVRRWGKLVECAGC